MARKAVSLKYPRTRSFSFADIDVLNDDISTQTVRKHVRRATGFGHLRITGRKPSCGRGRPCFVFEKV